MCLHAHAHKHKQLNEVQFLQRKNLSQQVPSPTPLTALGSHRGFGLASVYIARTFVVRKLG